MMKKTLPLILAAVMFSTLALPSLALGKEPSFKYRSTVFGLGVNETRQNVNEIVKESNYFYDNQSIYFLTRIFAIDSVDKFQFRHEVQDQNGRVVKRFDSRVFAPQRYFWPEVYHWDVIHSLPGGEYQMKVYIRMDEQAFRLHDTKTIQVISGQYNGQRAAAGASQYQDNNYYAYGQSGQYCSYCGRYICQPKPGYKLVWTRTGRDVYNTSGYEYAFRQEKNVFDQNEPVSVMTKLTDISQVESFQIKHEVLLNGRRFYDSKISPVKKPDYDFWYVNYSDTYFNRLPSGQHTINTLISLNGGAFQKIGSTVVTVKGAQVQRDVICAGSGQGDNGACVNIDQKSVFQSYENVIVVTNFSRLSGLDSLTVRHDLYRRGDSQPFLSKEVPTQYPNGSYWGRVHLASDFGRLVAGDYEVRVQLSVDGNSFREIDRVGIRVQGAYGYRPGEPAFNTPHQYSDFVYDGTRTGARY